MSSPGRNPRTLWQSYTNLPMRTRLYFGLGVGLVGAMGLAVADKLQEMLPANQKEADPSQSRSGAQVVPKSPAE
ncbi:hypothetical protein JB92DRAFT_3115374 [Gautieria morchelliformis]|nr:hypothetical protein JB92DRAFT_3115374 [Gautieria morchelliformis]